MRGQLSNEANRGVAQLASASGLGPEGPVFESLYPDILTRKLTDFQWVSFLLLCILLCKIKFHLFIVLFWMVCDKVLQKCMFLCIFNTSEKLPICS